MAFAVILLIGLHVTVLGYWVTRATGYRTTETCAQLSVLGAVGLTALGFLLLLLGHLFLLKRTPLLISTGIMLIGFAAMIPRFRQWWRPAISQLRPTGRLEWLLATASLITWVAIFLCGMRAPFATDELQYHWAAPQYWAAAGGWVATPYRLTNGPALAEILFTFGAVFGSSTAAHWTHAVCLLVLAMGCGALAKACGSRPWIGIAALLSIPVITSEAALAYNDTAAAAVALVGLVALICSAENEADPVRISAASLLTTGLLFAGAFSVKSFIIVSIAPASLYVGLAAWNEPARILPRLRRIVGRLLLLGAPVMLIIVVWVAHTYSLTHQYWDKLPAFYFVHSSTDPLWLNGGAIGRFPSMRDLITLPLVPLHAMLHGQREPYGGRIGLLVVPFSILTLIWIRRLANPKARQNAALLLVAAICYFLLLGPIIVKTRYHNFVWACLAPAAAAGFTLCRQKSSEWTGRVGMVLFALLACGGMADGARKTVMGPHLSIRELFRPASFHTAFNGVKTGDHSNTAGI